MGWFDEFVKCIILHNKIKYSIREGIHPSNEWKHVNNKAYEHLG